MISRDDGEEEEVPATQIQESPQLVAQPHQKSEEERGCNLRDENTRKKLAWMTDYDLDVKSAFLHGDLQEKVYIDQPPGYEKKGEKEKVYQLKKALYGLKQAPRAWYSRIDAQGSMHRKFLKGFKWKIASEFGLKLCKDKGGKAVDSTFYMQIIGSLMYLTSTRPYIMYAGTVDYGVFYKRPNNAGFVGYTYSDYAGDIDDRKSTFGHVFMLNSGAISWSSKKQQIVTLSLTDAEFVAAASSSCQAVWLRKMFEVFGDEQKGATIIYCDNMSTIKLSRNPVIHWRSKHIDGCFHFLCDLCRDGKIELQYCKIGEQFADILTKPLKQPAFEKQRSMLGVCSVQSVDQGKAADEEDYVMVENS
ncbi:unnamed protein product [Prunus armeniaca]